MPDNPRHTTEEWANEIVAIARSMNGTPFHHQGRSPGVGLDCTGLVMAVLKQLMVPYKEKFDYSEIVDDAVSREMGEWLIETMMPIRLDDAGPGDVLWLWVHRRNLGTHLALLTEGSYRMIHAVRDPSIYRVVEQSMGKFWSKRVVQAFRIPQPNGDRR